MDQRLARVFQRVFRVESVQLDSSPETVPGWDSLANLGLVSELEREFGIDLTPDEVVEMVNVRIIAEILATRGVISVDGKNP